MKGEEEPGQIRRLILPIVIGTALLAGAALFFNAGTTPQNVDIANVSRSSISADSTLQEPLVNGNGRVDTDAPNGEASAPAVEVHLLP